MTCPLCEHQRLTRHYHADHLCWVADCLSCGAGNPLVVLNRHTDKPTPQEFEQMVETATRLFPGCSFRFEMRQLPQHWHAHILP